MSQQHLEPSRLDPHTGRVPPMRPDRAAARRSRVIAWFRRHPVLADTCWVLPLTVLTGADIGHRDVWVDIWWQAALWLPVLFRRKTPVLVFVLVGVVAAAQWALVAPLGGDLAVLIVLYTVAAYRSRALALAAAVAVQVGVVLAVVRFGADMAPRFLLLLTILVIAALSLGITQQARRAHLAALTDRADRVEREAEQQAQLAAAAERTRIAREMHDIVAHSLSVMITLADGAALTDEPHQAQSAMRQVARTGREALADTRRVLDVLRTDLYPAERTPLPGIESLDILLATIRATGLHTSLSVTGTVFDVPEAGQLAIYRIVQEAVTNTLKHAHLAERAAIRLSYHFPEITVDITDDGRVDTSHATPPRAGAHGLVGIEERAALFHGRFAAGPHPGGWRVTAVLRFPDLAAPDPVALDYSSRLLSTPVSR